MNKCRAATDGGLGSFEIWCGLERKANHRTYADISLRHRLCCYAQYHDIRRQRCISAIFYFTDTCLVIFVDPQRQPILQLHTFKNQVGSIRRRCGTTEPWCKKYQSVPARIFIQANRSLLSVWPNHGKL